MLDAIELCRFKRFESEKFPLAPLTILLGPNSSGKSTVLQALLLLSQSMTPTSSLRTLSTTGPRVDLGRFGSLVFGQTEGEAEDLSIRIGIGPGRSVNFAFTGGTWPKDELPPVGTLTRLELVPGTGAWREDSSDIEAAEGKLALVSEPELTESLARTSATGPRFAEGDPEHDRVEGVGLISALPGASVVGGRHAFRVVIEGDLVTEVDLVRRARTVDDVDLPDFDRPRLIESVKRHFNVLAECRSLLTSAQWLGPLRSAGHRGYERRRRPPGPRDATGADLPDLLEDTDVLNHVNRWLGTLELNYQLGFETVGLSGFLTEILLRSTVGDAGKHTVGLPDVGSGIAQVLPMLAVCGEAVAAARTDLILLQQPELHLHPRQQGKLADVFAEVIGRRTATEAFPPDVPIPLERQNQLIVETHSETLVRAIQLLVSQRVLAPEDVSLLAFELQDSGHCAVRRIPLSPDGDFLAEWPNGFFPDADALRRRRL